MQIKVLLQNLHLTWCGQALEVSTVIPFVIFPQKADFLAFFSRGTWQRPTVWTINIYRYHFIFYWVFFRWNKKFLSKNFVHPSIDDYLLLKILREHDNGQKKLKILFYRGGHYKGGNMAKGITVIILIRSNN